MDVNSGKDERCSSELVEESNNVDSLDVIVSSAETMQDLGSMGEVIAKIEVDLACSSEKLANLGVLKLHVETRENEFETFAAEKEQCSNDSAQKAMEFELLSVLLDSEVRELSVLLSTLQIEIGCSRQIIPSCEDAGELYGVIEEKLNDAESSLKQSQEQILELKVQSSNLQRILLTSMGNVNWEDDDKALESLENAGPLTPNTKIKMQTAEHQRQVLQMLEKSLANELDLENKLSESKQREEELNLTFQQQLFCLEIELEDACGRLFAAENATEVLLGVSKELRGKLQRTHFNLKSALQREEDLKSKLKDSNELVLAKDSLLQKAENTCEELRTKVNSVDKQLKDSDLLQSATISAQKNLEMKIHEMEARINNLIEKSSIAERRAETAEAECKSLRDVNTELNKELSLLRNSSSVTSERIYLLERQLKESDLHLQHAVASAEASQEKQTMLNFTIKDMENLIEGLKSKVSKAESLTESAEEKCIILSEANAGLNDELNFLKSRMEFMEASLHRAEETKKTTARDISLRTKLITDLIMQLALERERLHKQISSLTKEKKALRKQFEQTLMKQLEQKEKVPDAVLGGDDAENTGESMLTEHKSCSANSPKESTKEATEVPLSDNMQDESETCQEIFEDEPKTEHTVSTSKLDSTRDIDARQLKFKYFLTAALLIMIPALLAVLYQHMNSSLG
ncbi:WPP domain-interacting tail-anchored protein 1-like [Ipomoea triloba]|uniref:WPP domain-interacting tail-anchored protein 1-like n=1 Tax=Ipomoea triloba TaxID=35885 RepID=UPI00125D5988|nr:WPP domain-interacting tail-anchored protein 1-like [Ipomoea triloba]XP_031095542.1 WPP domain-interacting tail-anchored protein 1-like [Ipomoea triloba]